MSQHCYENAMVQWFSKGRYMYTCVFGHVERDTHKPSSTPFMGNSLYIPPPENWHGNRKPTIWRCISCWKWGFSNVMLVFKGVFVWRFRFQNPRNEFSPWWFCRMGWLGDAEYPGKLTNGNLKITPWFEKGDSAEQKTFMTAFKSRGSFQSVPTRSFKPTLRCCWTRCGHTSLVSWCTHKSLHPQSLTVRPWKMMVGRLLSRWKTWLSTGVC